MFDNLLQLAADDDKATLTTMASKYPTLKEYFELGEKVKPVRDRLKALHSTYENDFEAPVKELEDWRKFRQKDWPDWQTEHTRVETALAEATAQIVELEATRGTDMTKEEVTEIINATLTAAGVAKTSDIEAQVKKIVTDTVTPVLHASVNGLTSRFEDVYAALTPKVRQHEKDFGDVLDVKEVFAHMKSMAEDRFKKTGIKQDIDPLEAYNDLYAPKFSEKNKNQTAAEKKAEYDKGVLEGKKAAMAEMGSSRNPVDGGSSAAQPSRLVRRAMAKMPKDKDGSVDTSKIPLGKGIGNAAAREYFQKKSEAVQ